MTTATYEEKPTFESVWALIQENARLAKESLEESQEKFDHEMKELKESQAETARQMKEFNKRFGDMDNRYGEAVEYMISPGLQNKFRDLGLDFETASTNFKVRDHKNN